VCLRCLEKDPARRFPGAGELDFALAGCGCAGAWTARRAADWWREHAAECDRLTQAPGRQRGDDDIAD
jgi:hypothetical protein